MSDFAPVSVIIPCYCCQLTIKRAVTSVINQSVLPYEVILIDDASSDGTLEVLQELEAKHKGWIKLISLPVNVGAASARNAGWDATTQPYIAFLDADDAWHTRKIEIQYEYMQKNKQVKLCGHLHLELAHQDRNILESVVNLESVKIVSWSSLLLKNRFVTPSVMLVKDIPFRFSVDKRYMEDHFLWLEVLSDEMIVVILNVSLVVTFKPSYGVSGLSSHLFAMQKEDLLSYHVLYKRKKLTFVQMLLLQCFSGLKFLRRLLIVYIIRPLTHLGN